MIIGRNNTLRLDTQRARPTNLPIFHFFWRFKLIPPIWGKSAFMIYDPTLELIGPSMGLDTKILCRLTGMRLTEYVSFFLRFCKTQGREYQSTMVVRCFRIWDHQNALKSWLKAKFFLGGFHHIFLTHPLLRDCLSPVIRFSCTNWGLQECFCWNPCRWQLGYSTTIDVSSRMCEVKSWNCH